MMWGLHGFGPGFGLMGGGFMMFLWLGLLVGGIVLLVRMVSPGTAGAGCGHATHAAYVPPVQPSVPVQLDAGTVAAADIAKQRYARGEITKDEYTEICRTLGL